MIDAMDKISGLSPEDPVFNARRFRPEFVEGAELCRLSVLHPDADKGFDRVFRIALALRMARLNADQVLIDDYGLQLADLNPSAELAALANGATDLAEPLATIASHVDMVTLSPIKADAGHIAKLVDAGLDNPQIVALSELIAFVNFQTRVAAGLRLMRLA
ncbi:CMD domain-containing protein [Agrobacterium tumefaciens]|uniref:CMD domain-containing protein n=1 Tax=Agrobacterium tumefaciens TaxID=358 RepID=UPI000714849A|nr:hypothetical protein ASD74_21050 [Rhizobium sp. Root564]NTC84127.1 hypothetical protein [Agrobacterium tumefaciens]NTD11652.1 hypothetical protein [Agrobacterium tumefaciens]